MAPTLDAGTLMRSAISLRTCAAVEISALAPFVASETVTRFSGTLAVTESA